MAEDASVSSLSTLTRFADVTRALRDDSLAPRSVGGSDHAEFRRAAFRAVSPANLTAWRPRIEAICVLPRFNDSLDLVEELAKPWSLSIAALVADISTREAERLSIFARAIFDAAAEPFEGKLRELAGRATTELAHSLKDPFALQAFVALSQTLPCFLANAWLALLQHPDQIRIFDKESEGIEELLRFAGPSRAVLRYPGPVALMLGEANRDPAQFADPNRLDLTRCPKHLAFGAGSHSCVGASLIRMAATIATKALVNTLEDCVVIQHSENRRFAMQETTALRIRRR